MKRTWNTALALGLGVLSPYACADGLLAVDNPAKNGAATGAYATVEAFGGNDQVAMRQYSKDWQGKYSARDGQNIGLLAARAEAGAQWNGYRLGALYRAEALTEANRDTADLMRQYKTSSGYDAGRTHRIDYAIKGFAADGARLGKSFQMNPGGKWQLDVGVGASWLRGKRVKLETVSGQVMTLNMKDFSANATWDSISSSMDTSGDAQFNPPYGARPSWSGHGFALDVGMLLRREDGLRLEAAVNDLAGRMSWKNLPAYAVNYTSATKYYDADGYVHFDTPATAQSSYRNLNQTLDPKVWLAAGYPIGAFELQAASSYTSGYWFPEFGVGYRVAPQWRLNADYDFRFKTVGISAHHRSLYLGLRTENTKFNQARAYGLTGGASISF
jgi:hypothetical protein